MTKPFGCLANTYHTKTIASIMVTLNTSLADLNHFCMASHRFGQFFFASVSFLHSTKALSSDSSAGNVAELNAWLLCRITSLNFEMALASSSSKVYFLAMFTACKRTSVHTFFTNIILVLRFIALIISSALNMLLLSSNTRDTFNSWSEQWRQK